jgi:hypothetical protein
LALGDSQPFIQASVKRTCALINTHIYVGERHPAGDFQPFLRVLAAQPANAPLKPAPEASGGGSGPSGKQTPPSKLSAEEQLAMNEKDLKQNDWGHQRC